MDRPVISDQHTAVTPKPEPPPESWWLRKDFYAQVQQQLDRLKRRPTTVPRRTDR